MPYDWRPEEEIAGREFPQLLAAIDAAEKVLKKLKRLRNQGRANDLDVEQARQARRLLLNILDAGNWRERRE